MVTVVDVEDIRIILNWIVQRLECEHGQFVDIKQDFYKMPESLAWYFDYENAPNGEAFGSFADEIDLLRKSVLSEEEDIPEAVMERAGYLLLYLAYQVELARGESGTATNT